MKGLIVGILITVFAYEVIAQESESQFFVKPTSEYCAKEKIMLEETDKIGYGNQIIFSGLSGANQDILTQVLVDPKSGKFTTWHWYFTLGIICVTSNGDHFDVYEMKEGKPI